MFLLAWFCVLDIRRKRREEKRFMKRWREMEWMIEALKPTPVDLGTTMSDLVDKDYSVDLGSKNYSIRLRKYRIIC